jgi:hypothetical protein
VSQNNTSYSEVNDFNKCQQYWFNRYVRGLSRIGTTGGPLAYGILGHRWLEHYYRTLMEIAGTNDVDYPTRIQAIGKANTELAILMSTDKKRYDWGVYGRLVTDLLPDYIRVESQFKFDILGVEKRLGDVLPRDGVETYDSADPDNIYVTGVVDVIIRPHKDVNYRKWAGKIGVMDHKFAENFPSDIAVKMNSQLPKQIHLLRGNGVDAEFGILNYLRYREIKNAQPHQLFKRYYPPCGENRTNNLMRDHEITSRQIIYLKNIPEEEAAKKVTKVANPLFCGNRSDRECEFFSLCNLELDGIDTKSTIEAFYKKRGA